MNLQIRRKPAHKHLHNALVANRRLSKLKEVNNKAKPALPADIATTAILDVHNTLVFIQEKHIDPFAFRRYEGGSEFLPPRSPPGPVPPLPLDQLASRALEADPRTRPEEEGALTMDLPAAMPRITPIIP